MRHLTLARAANNPPVSRKRRTLVLLGAESRRGESAALGSLKDVRAALAACNTSGDGGVPDSGNPLERLYGPGMSVELATSADPVTQAIVHVNDEPIAWPVLERMCRSRAWRLMDMESGRMMTFA